jgi:hypothetical protein
VSPETWLVAAQAELRSVFQGRLLRLGLRLVQAWLGAKEQSTLQWVWALPTENSTGTLSRAVKRGSLVMIEKSV